MTARHRSAFLPALLLCLLALLSAACTAPRPAGERAAPPPNSGAGAPAVPSGGGTGDGGTASDSAEWRKSGATAAERLADTDACYSLAVARVAKDIDIDRDIDAARGQVGSTLFPDQAVERRVDGYYYKKERLAWFEDCMRAKGYIRD